MAQYSLCTTNNTKDDITLQIPVTHFFFGRYISYRNVYCMIGNKFISELSKDKFQEELVTRTLPWILISSCPEPVSVYWFNAESFLQYTRDENTQSLRSNENTYLYEEKTADIAKCNVTGTWRTFDSDISNACGNIEGFRFPVRLDNALNLHTEINFTRSVTHSLYLMQNVIVIG